MTRARQPVPEVAVRSMKKRKPTLSQVVGAILRAALYGRISEALPDGSEEKTAVQLDDARAESEGFGWEIVGDYLDVDSGFKEGVWRPGFEQLLDDAEAGLVDVIVVWKLDRLTRQPKQIERVIDLLESEKLVGVYSMMEPMPLNAASRTHLIKTLREVVNYANHESRVKGDRQRRANRERALRGEVATTGGYRCFGFREDAITHHPDEAPEIVEAVDRILDGGWTLGGVVRDWNGRGITTSTRERVNQREPKRRRVDEGGEWRTSTLRKLLLSPRIAGLRAYKYDYSSGEYDSLVEAVWDPIVPRERWDRLRLLLLSNPGVGRKIARSYLLSGFGRCGAPQYDENGVVVVDENGEPKLCGSPLRAKPSYNRAGEKVPGYICPSKNDATFSSGCGGIRIKGEHFEREVVGRFLDLIGDPKSELRAALVSIRGDEPDDAAVAGEIEEIDEAIREADRDHRERRKNDPLYLPRARYAETVRNLTAQKEVLNRSRSRRQNRPMLEALFDSPQATWGGWTFDEKRAALGEALDYAVVGPPSYPYRKLFDPDRVRCEWKS